MHAMHSFVCWYLPEPSFGPLVEVFCAIIGFFDLLMHLGYDIFELLSIVTCLYPFSPTAPPLAQFLHCVHIAVKYPMPPYVQHSKATEPTGHTLTMYSMLYR